MYKRQKRHKQKESDQFNSLIQHQQCTRKRIDEYYVLVKGERMRSTKSIHLFTEIVKAI